MASVAPESSELVRPRVFVHPQGLCESDEVGGGTRVWAFAHVMSGARVGRYCNIGGGAFVEQGAWLGDRVTVKNQVMIFDGVRVEDDVFLGPGVIFTNDLRPRAGIRRGWTAPARPAEDDVPAGLARTRICAGATLGAGVIVVCGITVGHNAFVGAGAVLTRDVPAHALMLGNPARRHGWVCGCGERLDPRLRCDCGRRYGTAGSGLIELSAERPEAG